jgi:cyanophycin synthetase
MDLAQALCRAALDDTPFDLADALTQLRDLDEDVRLGPSTGCIVDAAVARNIPFSRMTEGSMVRFGWGSKQRRIQAAEMDITSAIAEAIAQDKELTKKLLAAAGFPYQEGDASQMPKTHGWRPVKSACRWSSSPKMATRERA